LGEFILGKRKLPLKVVVLIIVALVLALALAATLSVRAPVAVRGQAPAEQLSPASAKGGASMSDLLIQTL